MKRYIYNENFFNTWTADSSYVLGFWAADGYISQGTSKTWGIVQNDEEFLKKINEAMGNDIPVGRKDGSFIIRCYGSVYYDKMLELGYSNKKSTNMTIPELSPENLSHFIRGYFDGDGCVMNKGTAMKVVFTCGDERFLQRLKGLLQEHAGTKGGSIFSLKGTRAHQLSYSTRDSLKLKNYLYKHDGLALERKKQKFFSYDPSVNTLLSKHYEVTRPDGTKVVVENLREFIKENNLKTSIKNVIDKDKAYKGFRVKRIKN